MEADDLARGGEADARVIGFGSEEWRENVLATSAGIAEP